MNSRAVFDLPHLEIGAVEPVIQVCDLDVGDAEALAADRALLSRSERGRADRFHFECDRNRYTSGRAFLRRQLATILKCSPEALTFVEGPWGKPALSCGSVAFNLSHSGPLAVLAISTRGPVGIDVELIDRKGDLRQLSKSCFVEDECAVLEKLDTADFRPRFFAFWTAKEALMKLTGQGMSLPPLDIRLRLDEAGWPIGGAWSGAQVLDLAYPDLGRADAICCLARVVDSGDG